MGKFEDLERLQKLKEEGVLTEEEFNAEKTKVLNGDNNNSSNTTSNSVSNNSCNNNGEILEIKGDFPFAESKIPIELSEGEKIITQHSNSFYKNAAGIVTLTNRRIIFNKKNSTKSFLKTGLLGVALGAGEKDFNIEFAKIVSIESPKAFSGMGVLKITTNDGYTHNITFQSKTTMHKDGINARDMIAELIQNTIK